MTINLPFVFFPAIIELVRELVISNMHNRFEDDTWKTFQVIAPTRSNYWRKMRKIAINRPFKIFFQPLLNLSNNYLLVTCITNLKRIRGNFFQVIAPTRSNYWRKMRKIAINLPFWIFFLAINELVQELPISNMHNKFEEYTWKAFQVIAPTRSNYWRKRRKIAISWPFYFFFQPLLSLSENWSLVTCITNLGRIHEKHFTLSCPQVNVNADADDDDNDAELQLQ